ncbi:GerAB/ArcD/ProY family transporter [Bacillus benzoevorans]|nr:endospore germination permease [Bacillus benzoevorans]
MIEKGKISAVQIAMLLYTSIVVTGILFLPIITYLFAERDFWMAPILSMLLGFILVSVMCKLQRYYPKETIIQYCGSILGKGIGKIVSLLILLNLLYQSYMSFNAYALFVNDYYLPDTPKTVIMGSIAAACAFAVRGGVETIGRLAQLITPLLMILFMVLFLFLLTEIDLRNMFPILGNGVLPLLKATYFSNIWFSEFIYIGFLLPFLDNHQGGKKWVMLCCMSTMVSIVMISMVILLILGETLEGFTVPFATAVQFINIGEFFTHLESLVMAFWIMGAFIKMILLFYMLTLGWAQWYNLSDYRPFVIPAIFLVTLLAIWQIKNGPAYHLNIITIAPAAAHLSSLFPILLLLIAYFKKKKQKKTPRVQ